MSLQVTRPRAFPVPFDCRAVRFSRPPCCVVTVPTGYDSRLARARFGTRRLSECAGGSPLEHSAMHTSLSTHRRRRAFTPFTSVLSTLRPQPAWPASDVMSRKGGHDSKRSSKKRAAGAFRALRLHARSYDYSGAAADEGASGKGGENAARRQRIWRPQPIAL